MEIVLPDLFWALLNLTILIGIIGGVVYLLVYMVRSHKRNSRRLEGIEKKINEMAENAAKEDKEARKQGNKGDILKDTKKQ